MLAVLPLVSRYYWELAASLAGSLDSKARMMDPLQKTRVDEMRTRSSRFEHGTKPGILTNQLTSRQSDFAQV